MSKNVLLKLSLCVASAGLLTVAAFFWNIELSYRDQSQRALQLARQVAAQAEGIAFNAREQGQKDPLRFAAFMLGQGAEPRTLKVWRKDALSLDAPEWSDLDPQTGVFEYTKLITPEDHQGIRVQIETGYTGFLGAKSRLASDGLIAGLFILLFIVGGLVTRTRVGGLQAHAESDPESLKKLVRGWAQEAKAILLQTGVHVREMVREAQNLAVAGAKSRDLISQCRDRVHAGICDVREARRLLSEVAQSGVISEVIALNLAIEAARLGDQGRHLGGMSEELHRLVQKMRKFSTDGEKAVAEIEISLEPLATDADLAFHAYDDLPQTTQSLDAHIGKTSEALIAQSKLFQNVQSIKSTKESRTQAS